MNSKTLLFTSIIASTLFFYANEFTVPKASSKKVSAKKIKEQTLEQIGEALKLLIDLDRELVELRASLQSEFEAGIYSDGGVHVNSSSKQVRQSHLDITKELCADLEKEIKIIRLKIKKLKTKSLKG